MIERTKWKRRLRAKAWTFGARGLAILPHGISAGLLAGPGKLAGLGKPGRIAASNLELALGATHDANQRRTIQKDVFRHAAHQAALTTWLAHAPASNIAAWIENNVRIDESVQHLEKAHALGRGVIVATAHLGHWDLLAATLAHRGYQGAVVGRFRERDPSAAWFVKMRRNYGVETAAQDSAPRALLKILKRGEVLGLLCDLEVRRLDGEFLPFLGQEALTMSAPAALARAARAPIVPMRCVRLKPGEKHYTLLAEAPLIYDRDSPPKQARRNTLLALNQTYERWILETPAQWAWYQPRWRTRPGERENYPLAERQRRKPSSPGS